jgi:hypothetical protein
MKTKAAVANFSSGYSIFKTVYHDPMASERKRQQHYNSTRGFAGKRMKRAEVRKFLSRSEAVCKRQWKMLPSEGQHEFFPRKTWKTAQPGICGEAEDFCQEKKEIKLRQFKGCSKNEA